jgi:Ca2+-binding EF-hand superfamily protein
MNIRSRARNSATNSGSAGIVREASVSERARLAFNVYDRNRDGFLTKAELRRTSKKMTEAQVQ